MRGEAVTESITPSAARGPAAYRRALAAAAVAVALGLGALSFPKDDGLRHVGLAFADRFPDWGATYAFSRYAGHAGYDPWLGHDLLLRGAAALIGQLPGDRLTQQLVLVKLLAALFPLGLLLLALRRARLAEVIADGPTLALAVIVVAVVLAYPLARTTTIRPFLWGTPYLVFAVGARGTLGGTLSAAALFFVYPYLAWLYTLPVAFAQLVRGCRRFAVGTLLASAVALALQPAAFWSLLVELARSAGYRAQLDTAIGEFASALSHPWLYGAVLVGLALLVPRARPESRRLGPAQLLALLFLPFALRHARYLFDVELWLLFVIFGRDLVAVLAGALRSTASWWRERARRWSQNGDEPDDDDAAPAAGGSAPAPTRRAAPLTIRAILVVGYGACLVAAAALSAGKLGEVRQLHALLAVAPPGAQLLTEFNLQYLALFARPDLRLVPSSELGFWAPEIGAEYRAFFNQGDVCGLARRIDAAFFLEARGTYLDPRHTACLAGPATAAGYRLWTVHAGRRR